ncbi:acyl-CoA dehydrogenase [Loktanella sp. 3ANDIMAR09]|uniref:acyl-CoA dehydrogenase family protein n=1 Tax=Loktanella sp. 3ANDIMAR09 TaxID=1225657 RepID=UPI0006F3EFBE|nr:acyl-CoA dehydrogenase family protein [Loktanella sp. 3ANDIMAR09]KQI68827.1 acyl-CoA dehydrogenase [Loktanella sp. 3ANDIMAR09]
MNFDLTEERQMLQDGLRRYLRDQYTPALLSQIADSETGWSDAVWAGLAEIGVIGALFTEDQGGFGGAGFDIALVAEELGRVGATEPLIDTGLLGGGLIAALGDADQQALLEEVIAGHRQMALAHSEPGSRYDLSRVATTVTDGKLSGRKAVVVNGGAADRLIVSARSSGDVADEAGISLFIVDADAPGLTRRGYPLTGGGHAAEITLDNTPGTPLGAAGEGYQALAQVHARATLAISAEAVGLMDAIRTLTTDYLKTRKQFGQPIGKFQALQHRMADMLIEIEQARSAVINLAGHVDADALVRDTHVSATKTLVGQAARLVAEESIQLHGGIGMTQEYALAHLARRLVMVDHRFGDTLYHTERFVALAVA